MSLSLPPSSLNKSARKADYLFYKIKPLENKYALKRKRDIKRIGEREMTTTTTSVVNAFTLLAAATFVIVGELKREKTFQNGGNR